MRQSKLLATLDWIRFATDRRKPYLKGDFIMTNKSINFSKRLPIVPAYKSDEFIKKLNQNVISKETIKQFKETSNKM